MGVFWPITAGLGRHSTSNRTLKRIKTGFGAGGRSAVAGWTFRKQDGNSINGRDPSWS